MLRRAVSVAMAMSIVLSVASVARGEPTWTAPTRIAPPEGSTVPLDVWGSDLAVNASGDAVIGWRLEVVSTSLVQVMWRRAGTLAWSGPVRLAEGGGAPSVALDDRGNALAVFRTGIVQASFHRAGEQEWETPITIGEASVFDEPTVAFDRSGNALTAWNRWSDGYVAQAAVRAQSGSWQQPPTDLSAPTLNARSTPVLATGRGEEAVALWRVATGTSNTEHFQAAFRPAGSDGWGAPVDVSDVGTPADAHVAFDTAGGVTALWGQGRGRAIVTAYRPFGGTWQRAETLPAAGTALALAPGPSGGMLALWSTGERGLIEGTWRPSPGRAWQRTDLSTPGRKAEDGALATDTAGNAIAVWVERLTDDFYGPSVLRAALFPAASGRWEPALEIARSPSPAYEAHVAMDGDGNAVATWSPNGPYYHRSSLELLEFRGAGPILSRPAIPTSGGVGIPVRLSVTPVQWAAPLVGEPKWDLGDGTTATGDVVRHVYTRPGRYDVRVSAFDRDGATTASGLVEIGEPTLASTRGPSIKGVARVGHRLSCERGSWTGTEPIVYSYGWLRNDRAHATGKRYRVRAADVGASLACRVKATNGPKTVVKLSRSIRVRP